MPHTITLADKLALFDETWTPKIIAELNGQQVKLAKLDGQLAWHTHEHEDELFLVLEGSLTIEMRNHSVHLEKGDLYIVPKGTEHNPIALPGTAVLLFEPINTKHTGEKIIERTVTDQAWI